MLRYYPTFRIKTDLITNGSELKTLNGPYKGKYYITYDGRKFSGANPIVGPNEELRPLSEVLNSNYINASGFPNELKQQFVDKTPSLSIRANKQRNTGAPTSYFPFATEGDYKKGYLLRSFIKRVNDRGFVTEISNEEYANFINGTVDYDVSDYLVLQILWKLTGPLNSVRVNQYDTRAGIIETNKRLVENANKTFLGITDFIGGDYTKFAKPTL
jgi:hypothetical protein